MKLIYFSGSEDVDLHPLLVGHYQCPGSNKFGPHIRPYYIIHFVLNGTGTLINERGSHSVSKGEMFIIRTGENTTYIADKKEPWEYTWIGFSGSRTSLFDNAPDVIKTPAELDRKLYEYVKRGDKSPEIFLSILYELIYHIFAADDNEPRDERIRYVHRYIKYNYMDHITIDTLSAEFGFERSYLYRIFKKRYGIGPKEYLTRIRLENAKDLLTRGYSVAECAYMVGYSDAFSLSRAYKKCYGVPPSQDKVSSQE